MAEPLAALPGATSTDTAVKARVLPWAIPAEPPADQPESTSIDQAAKKVALRVRSGLDRSYRTVTGAIVGTWEQSRRQFRTVSQEHPLRLVIGVAVAAFIAGAALRIWRSNHD
jgi:hypothetical protein